MQSVNGWAILAAVVSNFVIGGLWYSPLLFIAPWLRMACVDKATFDAGLPKALAGDLFTSIVMALALNQVLRLAGATDISQALIVTVGVWFAFVATPQLPVVTYEHKPFAYFAIITGYRLVSMLVMAVLLTLWR